jgi:hypothetical protein
MRAVVCAWILFVALASISASYSQSMDGDRDPDAPPQAGPQQALIDCPHAEVFMGGARGGGKTSGVLGKWALKERHYGAHFNAVMFRRTTVSAEDAPQIPIRSAVLVEVPFFPTLRE